MDLAHVLLATIGLLLYFAGVELAWTAIREDKLRHDRTTATEWWIIFCWFIVVLVTFPSEVRRSR